jgi:hypothetical protein
VIVDPPDELGIGLAMRSAPDAPFVPDAVRSLPIVGLTVCYAGDPDIGRGVLRPLLGAFPPVLHTEVCPCPYLEMQRILDPLVPPGRRYAARARGPILSSAAKTHGAERLLNITGR